MKLSIVIPVYNVSAYIEKCLLSCINQKDVTADDYEIVIVNDGTKDNSMEIVEEIIKSMSLQRRITVVNQKNMGLSEARNTGMRHVSGDYVWFVDSDDWIDDDSVRSIIDALKDGEVDVLQMPYKLVYEGSSKVEIKHVRNIPKPITGKECMRISRMPNLTQSRIIKASFMREESLKYTPGILHEDAEFKPRLLYVTKSIRTLDRPLYNYLKRKNNSITASFTMRNMEGRWYGVKSMHEYSKDFSFRDKLLFNGDMNLNMYFVLTGLNKITAKERQSIIDELIKSRDIFERLIWTLSFKKFIVYISLFLSPKKILKLFIKR